MKPLDRRQRPLRSLRLSVTDRCNLRCAYCMPAEDYTWMPRADLLQFEELSRLVDAFCEAGVDRLRLTGGEPLLRQDLPDLVAMLAAKPGVRDLALTTNGVRLAEHAGALRRAGLDRLTVSLDTLEPERFRRMTKREALPRVLDGLEAAGAAGFTGTKINTVVVRGFNEDELTTMLVLGRRYGATVRFIEYMDVGGARDWSMQQVVPKEEILERVTRSFGAPPVPLPGRGSAPASEYALPDGQRFGVIASTTEPFCGACDRSRVTADGMWFRCLYAREGSDLRALLRSGAGGDALAGELRRAWRAREDAGAEDRFALHEAERTAQAPDAPHHEMHVRGG